MAHAPITVHPSHAHAESCSVLEGERLIQVRDLVLTARAGAFAFARSGTPHSCANAGDHAGTRPERST